MDTKTCSMCNIEKHINKFYKNIQSVKIVSVQEDFNITMIIKIKFYIIKRYIMRKIEEKYYYRKNNRCIQNKDLVRSYVELGSRLKILEEKSNTQQIAN